jgi:hypothetical protein
MDGHRVDKGEKTSAYNILVEKKPHKKPRNKCMIILK